MSNGDISMRWSTEVNPRTGVAHGEAFQGKKPQEFADYVQPVDVWSEWIRTHKSIVPVTPTPASNNYHTYDMGQIIAESERERSWTDFSF
jgi:hypothetical protein